MSHNSINLITPQQLLAQREQLLEAIAQTDAMLKAMGVKVPSTNHSQPDGKTKTSLLESTKDACRQMQTNLTRDTVTEWFAKKGQAVNKASIGIYLSNLAGDGVLRIVQEGKGGNEATKGT